MEVLNIAKKKNFDNGSNEYYRVSATIGYDSDGNRVRKQFYGSSKKEAEQKKQVYLSQLDRGIDVEGSLDRFSTLFELWFEEVHKANIGRSSYNRYSSLIRLHIKHALFYNTPLKEIKSIRIQQHLNKLPSKPTAERVYFLLNIFFKYCIKERVLLFNPLTNVNRPKVERTFNKKQYLSKADVDKLKIAFLKDEKLFIFLFALLTGLRQGEILALTHDDISMDDLTINVDKSLNRVSNVQSDGSTKYEVVISSTKTASSIREIPILKELIDPLRLHITKEKAKHMKLGVPFKSTNHLFTSSLCTPVHSAHLLERWKRIQRELEIKVISFHGLRHTFCTLLAELGVPLKTASVLMGHSDIQTTAKVYTHVDNQAKRAAINKLSTVM